MNKLLVSSVFLATTSAIACSFQVGTGPKPAQPQAQPAPVPTPVAPPAGSVSAVRLGRVRRPGAAAPPASTTGPATNPTSVPTTVPTAVPTTPPGTMPVMQGSNAFGSGTLDPAGYKASLYVLPAGITKMPDLAAMTPTGVFFAKTIDVSSRGMTGGFPGIDPNRNENFAIRFEAPLVVDNEGDYDLRIVSDDGAILFIDGTIIVDNDGARASAKDVSGPVHLVKGTHVVTVDYFQTSGNVALQFFCKAKGKAEAICPTRL